MMLFRPHRIVVMRDLAADDAPALARLHAGAFHRGWSEDEFERLLASSASLGEGAAFHEGGPIEGFVLSRVARPEAEILSIVVEPSVRRQGVARALFASHLERLRGLGVLELFLEVEDGNRAAVGFYRGFGFVTVGRREGYYRHASGPAGAALVQRCDLR
jgi:[ribosomal protein S18]-alanine N-acetyltransferase